MTNINLLPPEILERRRAEKRMTWVGLAAAATGVVLLAVYAFGYLGLQAKENDLALVQQQVQSAQAQADQLAIFEQRATELKTRRATAEVALASRQDWARLFSEMSLVLPSDVWVGTMAADQTDGLQIAGFAIDSPTDSPDLGHKAIAKTLVRLAELEQLKDVWLTNSTKGEYEKQPAITFTLTAGLTNATPGEGAK